MIRSQTLRAVLLAGFCTMTATASAAGQTVRGWVLDDATGIPVRDIIVSVMPAQADTVVARQLSEDGSFQIFVAVAGDYRVRVEALGFAPLIVELDLAEEAVLTVEVRLHAEALALEPVRVVAERSEPFYMRDVRMRQARGYGRFLTREDIDLYGGAGLADVLLTVPGLRLIDYPSDARRIPLVSTRASRASSGECYAALYLNGVRQFETRLETPGGAVDEGMLQRADELFLLSSADIEAVEVYRGVAEVPAEFGGSTAQCGVVAIWLRAGHDPTHDPAHRPVARFDASAVRQSLAGRHAPAAATAVEAGIYWRRSERTVIGLRVLRGQHPLPAPVLAELTTRLNSASYDMPSGAHPMHIHMGGPELRRHLLSGAAYSVVGAVRVYRAWREFTLNHREQGNSRFSTGGWGGGSAVIVEVPITPQLALHAAAGHDFLSFSGFKTLDQPDASTRARWRSSSLRLGIGYQVARGR